MASIETYTQPISLYRYRSLNTSVQLKNEIDAILNNYVWCSAFDNLNDPMEGSYFPSSVLKKSARFIDIKANLYDQKSAMGICSFSETHDNDLMWAHYADQFGGICIRYKVTSLLKFLPDKVDLVRLFYNEKVPTLRLQSKTNDQITKKVLSSKNYKWLHEREWRLLSSTKGKLLMEGTENAIACVYLGKRIADKTKDLLLDTLKKTKIPYKTMSIDGYNIQFRK